MEFQEYYSVNFDIWYDSVKNLYTELDDAIGNLQDKKIVGHEFLIGERVATAEEIAADKQAEAARVSERDNISPEAAAAKVKKVNQERANHCKYFSKTEWGNAKNYDLCIHSDDFGVQGTAEIIHSLFERRTDRG